MKKWELVDLFACWSSVVIVGLIGSIGFVLVVGIGVFVVGGGVCCC